MHKKRRPERFRGLRSRCALSAHVELFVLEGATPVPDRGRTFLHGPLWPYFFFAAAFLAGAFLAGAAAFFAGAFFAAALAILILPLSER